MFPNFLIIGAQKAGTTSLINYLAQHPEIYVPEDKEVSCFYEDQEYNKRFEHFPYINYYNNYNGQRYAGNAPVNLLYFAEKTAKNIYNFNPDMKIIAILRNPIERAFSAYWYFVRCGLETESFETALKREQEITKNGSFVQLCNFSYISHGYYWKQLNHYLSFFSEDNMLVLFYDDFKINSALVYDKIVSFLKLNKNIVPASAFKKYNAASMPKIPWVTNLVYKENFPKNIYKRVVPQSLRYKIHFRFVRKLLNANLSKFTYPSIHPATKQYLAQIFRKHNNKLEILLNKDLSHWNNN